MMDPITVIGTVASVCQLAQAALSLSKSLYTLGSALASASEDLQVLADDLRTFSQSLTLLSRLLEDSRCWYSDDIYLLTAKIIKDCAELYVKIDRVLVKLGCCGKSNWKLRMKFVYKEGQIRKLLSRLRDMKGTLATILMSLQVDLQLSLLNISIASKIQRTPEKPLQPETINYLMVAQKAVETGGFVSKYASTASPEVLPDHVQNSEVQFGSLSRGGYVSGPAQVLDEQAYMVNSFVVIPRGLEKQKPASVRSSCSTESFKSALSVQDADFDIARKIGAIQEILHVFKTALEILDNLIDRRLPSKNGELYNAARKLGQSLDIQSKEIDYVHIENFKALGEGYIRAFSGTLLVSLHGFSTMVMMGLVMKLHKYSAEHEELALSDFDCLTSFADECSRRILTQLDLIASSVTTQSTAPCQSSALTDASSFPNGLLTHKTFDSDHRHHLKHWLHENSKPRRHLKTGPLVSGSPQPDSKPERHLKTGPMASRSPRPDPKHDITTSGHRDERPEQYLPFIGYTFKRFDNFSNCNGVASTAVQSKASNTASVPPPTVPGEDSEKIESDHGEGKLLSDEKTSPTDVVCELEANIPLDPKLTDIAMLTASEATCTIKEDRSSQLIHATCEAPSDLITVDENEDHGFHSRELLPDYKMPLLSESCSQQKTAIALQLSQEFLGSGGDKSIIPAATPKIMVNTAEPLPGMKSPSEDVEIKQNNSYSYVNSKQFNRICKRRVARKDFEACLTTEHLLPTPHQISHLTTHESKEQELTWTYPALTSSQTDRIWWQAYISLIAFSSSQSDVFTILKDKLEDELELSPKNQFTDAALAHRLSDSFKQLTSLECDEVLVPGMQEILDMRNSIIRVVQTVDEQMGLEVAALGWSFVWVFLAIHEPLFFTRTTSPTALSIAAKSFTDLQTIVAIIARYAVMENLYQQSNGSLSLKSEYRISLVSLCSSLLQYFAASFVLGQRLARQNDSSNFVDEVHKCDTLMLEVKWKDNHCQYFRLAVGFDEWSDSDEDEDDDDEEEDEDEESFNDGSWERLGDVELEIETS